MMTERERERKKEKVRERERGERGEVNIDEELSTF